jgi:Methyltransferase domain
VRVTTDALGKIPGWFDALDQALFSWFLSAQAAAGQTGDLAEIGVFKGKSAILIGDHLQQGEVFTVIDLFEDPSENPQTEAEQKAYAGLTQRVFEANYLCFHSDLPSVIRGESRSILEHARAGAHRFVHIDASHLYEDVRVDLESARRLLGERGVVAIDDFRSAHTPGVAAAVWEAIVMGRLHALVVSENKLYATCPASDEWLEKLTTWLPRSGLGWDQQQVFDRPLLRVWPITPVGRRLAEALAPPAILRRFDETLELRRAGMSLGQVARFEARDLAAALRRRLG